EVRRDIADEVLAAVRQSFGNHRFAIERLSNSLANPGVNASACDRAKVLSSLAWAVLIARDSMTPEEWRELDLSKVYRNGDPTAVLAESRKVADGCTEFPGLLPNILANVALDSLQRGDIKHAQVTLNSLRNDADHTAILSRWVSDLEGRVHLAARDPQRALTRYRSARTTASSMAEAWRAEVGVARACEQLSDIECSHRAYAAAMNLEQVEGLTVPLDFDRGLYLAQREQVSRDYAQSLLEFGHAAQALEVLRNREALTLRDLVHWQLRMALPDDDASEWGASLGRYRRLRREMEELRAKLEMAPRSERSLHQAQLRAMRREARESLEAILLGQGLNRLSPPKRGVGPAVDLYRAALNDGLHTWALVDGVAHHFPPSTPLSSPMLEGLGFNGTGEEAKSWIRLHGEYDEAARVLIGSSAPTAYSLDLPLSTESGGLGSALVVVDPLGDLPESREEGQRIVARLQELGLRVTALRGEAVTRSAVLSAIESADVFHYAGHGKFESEDPWASYLPLNGGQVSVGDIALLERSPKLVVLSGCETGESRSQLGLAQSFLVAGSHYVLAAHREIPDAVARAVTEAFWTSADGSSSHQAVFAWAQASQSLDQEHPDAGWDAFRLLTR
ncbi:MAG: CHAT domain-containing protein, partial [Myxococcota bacterium]